MTPQNEHTLSSFMQLEYFAEHLQDELIERSMLSPAGYTLRLLGLAFPVYSTMTDGQLTTFRGAFSDASRAIGGSTQPSMPEAIAPTPEEDQ